MGGAHETTQAQRAALDAWYKAAAASDALFLWFATEGSVTAAEKLSTLLNTQRGCLSLIGLERRERQVGQAIELSPESELEVDLTKLTQEELDTLESLHDKVS